ncbi:MAG: tetratricopeptide repeat protein [Brevinematia bacterium]
MRNVITTVYVIALVIVLTLSVYPTGDENLFKIGIGAFKDELYMVAESQFKLIVEQYPNSRYFQDSLYYLLLSQYFQKKYSDALKTVALIEGKYRYIKHFPKTIYLKGRILFDTSDYRGAIKSFETYLKNYPIDEDAPYSGYYMAMAYYHLTNSERAIQILEDLEKSYPNAPIIEDIKFRIAKIYFESENLDTSYLRFKEFEKSYPNSKFFPEVLYTLGKILFQKGSSPKIQTNLIYDSGVYFQRVSELQSYLKPYATFNAGVAFLLIGQYESAKELFSRLIDEFSISSDQNIKDMVNEATYNLGKIYQILGDYENSIKAHKASIAQGGKFSTKSVLELAELLNSRGNSEEAIGILSQHTNFSEVLLKYSLLLQQKDPESSEDILFSLATSTDVEKNTKNEAIVELLKLLLKKAKYEAIVSNFKTLLKNSTDEFTTSFVFFSLGEANLNLKDYRSAISAYSQVSDPSLKEDATEGIAYAHYLSENYTLAIKSYNNLLNSPKYQDRANYLIGVCYEKLRKTDEAKKHYSQLVASGKDSKYVTSGVINLGWVYVREKNFDEAINLVSKHLSTTTEIGSYEYLSEILAWAYDGKGDYLKAIEILRKLVLLKEVSDLQKVRYYSYISLFYEKGGQLKEALDIVEKELLPLTTRKNLTNHTVDGIGRAIELSVKLKDNSRLSTYTLELKTKYTNFHKSYEYLYRYSEYLYSNERYKEAGDEFLFVARNSQDRSLSDEAYFWGGWAYYNANRIQDAVNVFNEFVNKSSSSKVASVLLTLGDVMVNQKKFTEARNYYQRIVNEFKGTPEYNEAVIRLSKISSLAKAEDTKQQKPSVQQSQPQQPTYPQMSPTKQEQFPQKSIEEIISSLETISKSKDRESASKAKFELAMIYKSQKNYQKAIDLLQEITEEVYNETSAMAQFEIGEILRMNGDYGRAWKEYIKVIYIYKDYKDVVVKAMYYTIFCYIQIKEYDQAKKLYEKMLRDFYKNPWTEKAEELIKKI